MPALETFVQWLALLAQSALFGGLCLDAVCLRDPAARALKAATVASRNQFNLLAIIACVLAAILATLAPPRELATIARWGVGAARLIGLLGVFALIRVGRMRIAVIVAGALLTLQIPSSRFAALPDAAIPLIADLLHFTAAAVWLGGVARLGFILAPAAARGPELIGGVGAAIRRFSPVAMACVLILTLTGLAQANLVLADLDTALSTGYGRTLLLKIVLLAGLIGLGALHQMALGPRLATLRGRPGADAPAALALMRRTLLIELGAGTAVLGAAALLVAWPGLCLSGCAAGAPASTPSAYPRGTVLTVFAAASLTGAFGDIGRNFESANPGVKVQFNFAGSQTLRTQIQQGAPADVIASANTAEMDTLEAGKLVISDTVRIFLTNKLVVVMPAKNSAGLVALADLSKRGLKIVLAAKEVPAGNYAAQSLGKLDASLGEGFKDKVLANVVSYENDVKQVVAKVQLGEADAGIVYASDAVAAPDLKKIEIPDDGNVAARYPLAPLAQSKNPELARSFVAAVVSAEGQAILQRWGFSPIR